MAVGFPLQNQVAMMNMMIAGQGNGAVALQNTALRQAQCSCCQSDPNTGQHICECMVVAAYVNQGYGTMQDVLQQAVYCDCPMCQYAPYVGGSGGLQMGGALSPLAAGFGMGGSIPMNTFGMGGLQMNPLSLQGLSPPGGAGFGRIAGLGGLSGLGGAGGLSGLGGMMAPGLGGLGGLGLGGLGANSSRMLGFQMGGGMNRRSPGRGNVGRLGYSSSR